MSETDRRAAAVLGASVADAAALGLHWIYDPARIAQVADAHGRAAFLPIDAENYKDVPAYFAHAARTNGDLSQYGEAMRLTLGAIGPDGFDVAAYQDAFTQHFGPGGGYRGYIDRPTRGTLDNLAKDVKAPSGIDDDQLPAITRLPVVVAFGAPQDVDAAIQVTNVNDIATAYGQVFAMLLRDVLQGTPVRDALTHAAQKHDDLQAALDADEADSVAYGEITGRACHLPMAMPLAFHIMARADSFADAINRNIRAGGDSCGRAMIIGSVMGAAHGIEGQGIPLDWILQTNAGADIWRGCAALATQGR